MNLSPSGLLMIVVLTTIANLVILVGASARSRNNRARRLAAVEGMLSSSYVGGAAGASWPGPAADDRDDSADAYIEGPDDADRPVDAGEPAGALSIVGRDPLTGLLDASSFDDVLAHEDARERRYGRAATVVIFELDGLSTIVDSLGPGIGNRIEVALADTIAKQARRADYVARLEPGRYGVLLPETDEIAAINHVERIRDACDLWLESGAIAIRLAIGWASTGGGIQLAAALRTANDRMLVEMQQNARLAIDDGAGADEGAVADGGVADALGVREPDEG